MGVCQAMVPIGDTKQVISEEKMVQLKPDVNDLYQMVTAHVHLPKHSLLVEGNTYLVSYQF